MLRGLLARLLEEVEEEQEAAVGVGGVSGGEMSEQSGLPAIAMSVLKVDKKHNFMFHMFCFLYTRLLRTLEYTLLFL